jgi:uncharacterized membrane protein YhfC
MLFAAPVQILFMVLGPLALGVWLRRRGFGEWKVFFVGAAAFVGSQVVHIPLLVGLTLLAKQSFFPHPPDAWKLPVNAVVLGLAAGACEEPARWLALHFWVKNGRGWKAALMLGAGHGGVESFLLGALAAVNFVAMLLMRTVDPARLGVPADKVATVHDAVAKYWSTPAYMALLGAAERAMAITIHLAASVLVMRAVTTRRRAWLFLAIGYHALVDGCAVYVSGRWGTVATEEVTLGWAALGILVIAIMRDRPKEPEDVVSVSLT